MSLLQRHLGLLATASNHYQAIPNLPEHRLRPLVERFAQLACEQPIFRESFGLL